jgi:hypothetical protein
VALAAGLGRRHRRGRRAGHDRLAGTRPCRRCRRRSHAVARRGHHLHPEPAASTPAATAAATPAPSERPTAPAATLTGAPATVPLAVVTPRDGDVVTSDTLLVAGTGPANARIVRDIPFGFDDEATSDAGGSCFMDIVLDAGPNELVFRVGDDASTAITLRVTYAPEPEATPEPTAEPTAAPTAGGNVATIDDGTWIVGDEIRPGTYRLREPALFCYWARLNGFGGGLNAIIANDNVTGYGVVTIRSTDRGFETSGCGTWSRDLSQVTDSRTRFGEGTFIVGTDLRPGTYRATGGDFCYWARLRDFRGQLGSIIANGLSEGRAIVTIRSTDRGFESSGSSTSAASCASPPTGSRPTRRAPSRTTSPTSTPTRPPAASCPPPWSSLRMPTASFLRPRQPA